MLGKQYEHMLFMHVCMHTCTLLCENIWYGGLLDTELNFSVVADWQAMIQALNWILKY